MPKSLVALCIFILSMGALASFVIAEDPDYFIGFELQPVTDEGIERIEGAGHYCTDDYVSLTAYVKDGYIFSGWYDGSGNLLESSETYTFFAYNEPIFAKSERGYKLDLMRMDGVLASTSRTVALGKSVTLLAIDSGSSFLGWYTPEGELFTKEKDYTFTPVSDMRLIAKTDSTFFDGDGRLSWKLSKSFGDDVEVTVTDRYSRYYIAGYEGVTEGTLMLIPGSYRIEAREALPDGTMRTETIDSHIDGDIARRYCWMFGDRPQQIVWTVGSEDYSRCVDSKADRFPDDDERLEFVDYRSGSMKALASTMLERTAGMTDLGRAEYVLKFVQLITDYEDDSLISSSGEYWKYPIETLVQRGGDCEDTSILYCSLMKAMGYSTALLIYEGYDYYDVGGHMAASVALDYVKNGTYYTKNGLKYYYCETTSDTMGVGEDWDIYDDAVVLVLPGENDINREVMGPS